MIPQAQEVLSEILITGFEPFGRVRINPSGLLAKALDGEVVAGRRLRGVVLPVSLDALLPEIERLIELHDPDLVIGFGVAEEATRLRIEQRAYNEADFRIPDNTGQLVQGAKLAQNAPDELDTALPVETILAALKQEGFEADPSDDPGRFLCNASFYLFRQRVAAGFIHVPPLPNSLDGAPPAGPWPFLTQLSAALCLIEAALVHL